MKNDSRITRINRQDPRCQAALRSERELFDYYQLDYSEHFVELAEPNLKVRVLAVGEGRPLLMVPGGTGDAVFFAPLMAQLKGWRMIAINRPGGGLSDGIDHRQVDVNQLAVDTMYAVAHAFGLERFPIVSNSMGGLWSLWFALAHPERVSHMVQLGCPALILNTSAPLFMRLLSVPGINRLIAPNMQPKSVAKALDGLRFQGSSQVDIDNMPDVGAEVAYTFFNLPTYLDSWKTLVGAVANLGGANPKYQLRAEQVRQVEQPTLFIWGDNDPFGGLDVAHEVVQMMPQAQLREMQTGHLPFLDQPEVSGRLICEFLEQHHVVTAAEARK